MAEKSLNDRAIDSLKLGQEHLDEYFRTRSQDELKRAQEDFQRLVEEAPRYIDGMLLLGFALTENREEQRAIAVYDRALMALDSSTAAGGWDEDGKGFPQTANIDLEQERRRFEIRFLRASAEFRLYDWDHVVDAANILQQLNESLRQRLETIEKSEGGVRYIKNKKTADICHYYFYLRARTYAEIGHSFGHLIVLLHLAAPTPLHLKALQPLFGSDKIFKLPARDGVREQSLAALLLAQSQEFVRRAKSVEPIHRREWKRDLSARLSEVMGYAEFRYAEWLPPSDDNEFRRGCTSALRYLDSALLHNSKSYALLQNIGMIYLNRRYDLVGTFLDEAERLNQRSIELKPGDYYGYQQLARVKLRRACSIVGQVDKKQTLNEMVNDGVDLIQKAIDLRPNSNTCRQIKLHFEILGVVLNEGDAQRQLSLMSNSRELLDGLMSVRHDPTPIVAYLQLLLSFERLRTCDVRQFDQNKKLTAAACEQTAALAEKKADYEWICREIRNAVAEALGKLGTISFENRAEYRPRFDACLV